VRQDSCHRISLEVYAHNRRAQRTYEQAGFVVEGRMRGALRLGGRRIDVIVMAALATEWSGA
jgi:RimJ/RimL family protein N-acetyltransferase